MARARKRHVQQELFRHGGKRRGAGRKPRRARASERHETRPKIDETQVLHVVLRVVPAVGNLRTPSMYDAIRQATQTVLKRGRIRIVHVSIQHDHLHLLVEAADKQALASGMLGFQISAARRINKVLAANGQPRTGKVFNDRYHLVVSTSPTQTRLALAYVLCNWRKHREDRGRDERRWLLDPYSSARAFPDWKELDGARVVTPGVPKCGALAVSEPRCWLLRSGWKLVGAISAYHVPSRRP